MSNAMHDDALILDDGAAEASDHPAGQISVSGKTRAGARARALAGLTLSMSAFVMATTCYSTTVSAQGAV